MEAVIVSDYFYGEESEQFSYFRIPRLLVRSKKFKMLSTDAKLLYGLMLDRMGLSAKHGWHDELGRVYMFGVHLEKEPNRFQRMEVTHPKQYDFCIHKLGCGDVLDYLHIPKTTKERTPSMEHEKGYQPDILAFLEKVVHKNTLAYAEDFNIDKNTLQLSADASDVEHRSFLWLSRPNGTWCVPEREAFLRDSSAYHTWTFYANQPKGIMAYRVVVDGFRDRKLAGRVIPLDYAKQAQRVIKSALPITKVQYRDKDEYFCESRYDTFRYDVMRWETGIHDIRYVPENEAELQSLLMLEHQMEKQDKRPRRTKSVTMQR